MFLKLSIKIIIILIFYEGYKYSQKKYHFIILQYDNYFFMILYFFHKGCREINF